jgi:hypothetical protein
MKLSELNPIKTHVTEAYKPLEGEEKAAQEEKLKDAIEGEFDTNAAMTQKIYDYLINNDDDDSVYEFLMDKFSEDMPYGTQKARDGDPHNWIADHMSHMFKDEMKGL